MKSNTVAVGFIVQCQTHSVTRFNLATLLKVTFLDGCFSRFLSCTNGTKSRNASHIWLPHITKVTLIPKNSILVKINFSFLLQHYEKDADGLCTKLKKPFIQSKGMSSQDFKSVFYKGLFVNFLTTFLSVKRLRKLSWGVIFSHFTNRKENMDLHGINL